MEDRLKIIAVCGWAIPKQWFAQLVEESFPGSEVLVLYPSHPKDREEAKELLENISCDLYIGYSLGSLWLLYHKEFLSPAASKARLASLLDFTDRKKAAKFHQAD